MFKPGSVSIIIPCHNQAEFLGSAVESALAQGGCKLELIVIDDGSTDATSRVAAQYPELRLVRQNQSGVSAARNRGFAESSGEYIVFLDADDRLLAGAVEQGVASLREHPQCAFVSGLIELIAADGSKLSAPYQPVITANHYLELLRHNYIWTAGAVMYRRSALEAAGGFNTSISASADIDLNLRVARLFPVHCHGKTVLQYRRHSNNMTINSALMLKHAVTARRLHRKHLAGNRDYERALDEGIRIVQEDYGEALVAAIRCNVKAGKFMEAARQILTLSRYYPRRVFHWPFQKLYGLALRTGSLIGR